MNEQSQRKFSHAATQAETSEFARFVGARSKEDRAPFSLEERSLKAASNPLLAASQERRSVS
jgi:hypothetical protein